MILIKEQIKIFSFQQLPSSSLKLPFQIKFIYKNKITYWRNCLFFLALQYQMKKYEYIPSP
ncbi:hypothetical protein BBH99_12885 [Chryseobacterium contaminans]|uniref:Uncharacterized protein n=1 Tax=Chryseobacterium contaminans TaxID=1423959 RepID=A0ABX2X6M4_9FLAO|nr:hypothetical protein BBH99_12885 [Chryseobacterium contaminans]